MKWFLSLLGLYALVVITVADEAVFKNITIQYESQLRNRLSNYTSGCSGSKVAVRREWGDLTRKQRADYIRAVKCLQAKPPKAPAYLVPGARSRFDDFAGVHIHQTFDIHFNGVFLAWHRYFVWKYEKALREECGYKGYQPYWEWSRHSSDPESSPLFDGSEYSLSGNGESIPHGNLTFTIPRTNITVNIPPGTGGGCIHDGPFKDMKVNLGPTKYSGIYGPVIGSGSGLDFNPRCLRRDINPGISSARLNYDAVTDLLINSNNYFDLTNNMGRLGVHPSGHNTVGGLMDDQFSSAGDPVFYMHHAQVDRMWTLWQSLDPPNRQTQLQGSLTWFNIPPSRNITAQDPIGLWFEGEAKAAVDLTNTIANDFCYMYC